MSDEVWTHGVATIVESPQNAKLIEHRGDLGTVIEQMGISGGWFHIPVSPVGSGLTLEYIYLAAKLNDYAKLALIHVRRGSSLIASRSTAFAGEAVHRMIDITDVDMPEGAPGTGNGLVICLNVLFLSETHIGRAEFYGAGLGYS